MIPDVILRKAFKNFQHFNFKTELVFYINLQSNEIFRHQFRDDLKVSAHQLISLSQMNEKKKS